MTFGVDAKTASGTAALGIGWRFYNAAGGSVQTSPASISVNTTSKRVYYTATVPAAKFRAQPMLSAATAGVIVTAPSTGGAVDTGSPRRSVLFENLVPTSYSGKRHALAITLREV